MVTEPGAETAKAGALPAPTLEIGIGLFLCGSGLRGLGAFQYGMTASTLLHEDCQSNGGDHKDNGTPRCEPRQQVGCATRTEGRLRTLTAEGAGKIGAFTLLQQDDDNENCTDDYVDNEK